MFFHFSSKNQDDNVHSHYFMLIQIFLKCNMSNKYNTRVFQDINRNTIFYCYNALSCHPGLRMAWDKLVGSWTDQSEFRRRKQWTWIYSYNLIQLMPREKLNFLYKLKKVLFETLNNYKLVLNEMWEKMSWNVVETTKTQKIRDQ